MTASKRTRPPKRRFATPADRALFEKRRRLRRAYYFQNGFVLLVSILFLVSSLSFWMDPEQIGRSLGHDYAAPFDYVWNVFYTLGSVMVMYGLLDRRVGFEAAGHALLVPGLGLNFVIAASVLGLHSQTILIVIFGFAAASRAIGLILGWREDRDE